ncbi:hypothetical protein PM082_002242 [Marasmius tenuissimus]|nr:hypothetical protein PM082_002242 [Marasmius tenuissimus]
MPLPRRVLRATSTFAASSRRMGCWILLGTSALAFCYLDCATLFSRRHLTPKGGNKPHGERRNDESDKSRCCRYLRRRNEPPTVAKRGRLLRVFGDQAVGYRGSSGTVLRCTPLVILLWLNTGFCPRTLSSMMLSKRTPFAIDFLFSRADGHVTSFVHANSTLASIRSTSSRYGTAGKFRIKLSPA